MKFSDRFLSLVDEQLSGFESDAELETVVAYVAQANQQDAPTLEVVGQRPKQIQKKLAPIENDPDLRVPSSNRRWYPLQEGSDLLGVLRAERFPTDRQWPDSLDQRLQISASILGNYLSLELDREKLLNELSEQKDQIGVLVHQLRNPLAALRTYAQLLLRKLGPDSKQRSLVEGLLSEQQQVDKYLLALDEISRPKLAPQPAAPARLLLPPLIQTEEPLDLMQLLDPLIDRAKATAKLQGRKWQGPEKLPSWIQKTRPASEGVIAEIVANLLENAFRYASKSSEIGICINEQGISVWDAGIPIPIDEREEIFNTGFRSQKSKGFKGSGLGLSLGRKLARQFGGDLTLSVSPSEFDDALPKEGNAFLISLPAK
ncbi:two-component sensor histidine kinase [Prochlorococcus sp. MIT 0602]|nr:MULTISPECIES: HAMP domain-containing sensor histidine kinase [unclassified Prochlorococcus]KGG16658.1 two-component sensor histidine kinase [Prochlorococcus sp. MIT 0602]